MFIVITKKIKSNDHFIDINKVKYITFTNVKSIDITDEYITINSSVGKPSQSYKTKLGGLVSYDIEEVNNA